MSRRCVGGLWEGLWQAWRQVCTPREYETRVTSEPARSILHSPMGTVKSLSSTSGPMSKDMPYRISFSRKTTGLSSRIAALSSPRASSAEYGAMTWRRRGVDGGGARPSGSAGQRKG